MKTFQEYYLEEDDHEFCEWLSENVEQLNEFIDPITLGAIGAGAKAILGSKVALGALGVGGAIMAKNTPDFIQGYHNVKDAIQNPISFLTGNLRHKQLAIAAYKAHHGIAEPHELRLLVNHKQPHLRKIAAESPNLNNRQVKRLLRDSDYRVRNHMKRYHSNWLIHQGSKFVEADEVGKYPHLDSGVEDLSISHPTKKLKRSVTKFEGHGEIEPEEIPVKDVKNAESHVHPEHRELYNWLTNHTNIGLKNHEIHPHQSNYTFVERSAGGTSALALTQEHLEKSGYKKRKDMKSYGKRIGDKLHIFTPRLENSHRAEIGHSIEDYKEEPESVPDTPKEPPKKIQLASIDKPKVQPIEEPLKVVSKPKSKAVQEPTETPLKKVSEIKPKRTSPKKSKSVVAKSEAQPTVTSTITPKSKDKVTGPSVKAGLIKSLSSTFPDKKIRMSSTSDHIWVDNPDFKSTHEHVHNFFTDSGFTHEKKREKGPLIDGKSVTRTVSHYTHPSGLGFKISQIKGKGRHLKPEDLSYSIIDTSVK